MAKSPKTPNTNTEPTGEVFDALAPVNYTDGKGEEGTQWINVGRAFPNSRGGFNVKLRAIPVAQDGEVTIVIAKREPRDR